MKYSEDWDLSTIPDDRLKSEWARRSSRKRWNYKGGKKPSCECGQCRKCKLREAQRRHRRLVKLHQK